MACKSPIVERGAVNSQDKRYLNIESPPRLQNAEYFAGGLIRISHMLKHLLANRVMKRLAVEWQRFNSANDIDLRTGANIQVNELRVNSCARGADVKSPVAGRHPT